MVANKGIICTKIGCRFDEKHQMRQPLLSWANFIVGKYYLIQCHGVVVGQINAQSFAYIQVSI